MNAATLEFHNLYHAIREGSREKVILAHVSGRWQQGCAIAVRGASGSGKTTLLSIIAGLRTPTAGAVLYNGAPIDVRMLNDCASCTTAAIGYVFQESLLIPTFSVLENVILKGLIAGDAPAYAEQQGIALLKSVHLVHKMHELPTRLSGGEQQRIAVARALYGGMSFLLLDEPTAHLDSAAKHDMIDLLLQMRAEHRYGIIIATHDENVASAMDELWELRQGVLERVR